MSIHPPCATELSAENFKDQQLGQASSDSRDRTTACGYHAEQVSLKVAVVPVIPIFTHRLDEPPLDDNYWVLPLTAEERTRSRLYCTTDEGHEVYLQLPRGSLLQDGDWLGADGGEMLQIWAKPEPVLTVTSQFPLALLQAAYHLGNRHVPLEITATYLRLSPDPVLQSLLEHRGLHVVEEVAPFQPETGAYGGHHHS